MNDELKTAPEEQKKQLIQQIANMLDYTPFTFEVEVKKNPKGIRIIQEVTREQLDDIMNQVKKKHHADSPRE